MSTEIFVEGLQADLTGDIEALFTYAVSDVADFSARNTAFSKTIKLPGTANNNILFGQAFEFTAYNPYNPSLPNAGANFNAAKAARCLVLLHGIQVFKGVIRLMKITLADGVIEYETAVFGELGGLVTAIGAKKLTGNDDPTDDLDFSAYDQQWDAANILNSWNARNTTGGGAGVYFPLIDYGLVSTNKLDYNYAAMRPALYVREYIAKILEGAGYQWDAPFFNTYFFRRLIIPHNEDKLYKLVRLMIDNGTPGHTAFLSAGFTTGTPVPTSGNQSTDLNLSTVNTSVSNFTIGASGTGTTFTYNAGAPTTYCKLDLSLTAHYSGGQNKVNANFSIRKNGSNIGNYTFTLTGPSIFLTPPPGAQTIPQAISISVSHILISPGDVITVHGVASPIGSSWTGINAFQLNVDNGGLFRIEAEQATAAPAQYNDALQINNCIPKGVLQKDFLLSIVKMFGLRIIEDPDQTHFLHILPFHSGMSGVTDFFNNASPLNWSNKVDRSRPITLTPMSEVNARYFNFLYDTDSDYYNDLYKNRYAAGYADRTFDNGLDFAKDKSDLKLIFAPSPLVGSPTGSYTGRDKVVTVILKYDSSTRTESQVASKIRILQSELVGSVPWNMLDDTGSSLFAFGSYGYAGHVDDPQAPTGSDLNFGAPAEIYWAPLVPYSAPNLFAAFHSPYMAEITDKDSKLLTCYVRLSELDIAQLDFARAIVIDGQIWRLNKVIDFDAVEDGVTQVELLKVINLSY